MDLADYGEKLLKNVSFLLDLLSNDNLEIKEIDDNNIISIINENKEEEKIDINDIINIFSYIKNHYEDVVNKRPDWELVNIYADEGISGTSLKNRNNFIIMLN